MDAGVTLAQMVDLRDDPPMSRHRDELLSRRVPVRDGWTVAEAFPGRAGPRLEGVAIARIAGRGPVADEPETRRLRPAGDLGRLRAAGPARLPRRRPPRL